MKIAFVGKGGSGKTTLAGLFSRYIASQSFPILAIDADINQHLASALGMPETEAAAIPAMGLGIDRIKEYLRGSNPRIHSNEAMAKTTPPGRGSRLITPTQQNPIFSQFARVIGGVRLLAVGPFSQEDLGIKCYHSKTGAVELLLNHMIDSPNQYVAVDMTAGADSFASGMFTKFDLTVLVVEPTLKSTSVYRQYKQYAKDHDVAIAVVGNKVEDQADVEFLQEQVGDDLVAWFSRSDYIRSMEKGRKLPLSALEPKNIEALQSLKRSLDTQDQNWSKFYQQAIEFHVRNAKSWASQSAGEDLTRQIDPVFRLEPELVSH